MPFANWGTLGKTPYTTSRQDTYASGQHAFHKYLPSTSCGPSAGYRVVTRLITLKDPLIMSSCLISFTALTT